MRYECLNDSLLEYVTDLNRVYKGVLILSLYISVI